MPGKLGGKCCCFFYIKYVLAHVSGKTVAGFLEAISEEREQFSCQHQSWFSRQIQRPIHTFMGICASVSPAALANSVQRDKDNAKHRKVNKLFHMPLFIFCNPSKKNWRRPSNVLPSTGYGALRGCWERHEFTFLNFMRRVSLRGSVSLAHIFFLPHPWRQCLLSQKFGLKIFADIEKKTLLNASLSRLEV